MNRRAHEYYHKALKEFPSLGNTKKEELHTALWKPLRLEAHKVKGTCRLQKQ